MTKETTVRFRIAAPTDLPALLELFPLYYAADSIPYDHTRAVRAIGDVIANPALGRIYMIELVSGRAVGYLALTFGFSFEFGGRTAFVDELFIREDFQGRGFGSSAIRHAISECAREGFSAIRLEVTPKNDRAAALYGRLGFRDHSRSLMSYAL